MPSSPRTSSSHQDTMSPSTPTIEFSSRSMNTAWSLGGLPTSSQRQLGVQRASQLSFSLSPPRPSHMWDFMFELVCTSLLDPFEVVFLGARARRPPPRSKRQLYHEIDIWSATRSARGSPSTTTPSCSTTKSQIQQPRVSCSCLSLEWPTIHQAKHGESAVPSRLRREKRQSPLLITHSRFVNSGQFHPVSLRMEGWG